jgi:hypothetical protein
MYPQQGPLSGGTLLTLFAATAVINSADLKCRFGLDAEVPGLVISPTRVQCTAPALNDSSASVGMRQMEVDLTLGGRRYSGNSVLFSYQAPIRIDSVSPSATSTDGGSVVTVRGSNFDPIRTVCRFGIQTVPAIFNSPGEVQCITPAVKQVGRQALAISVNSGHDWFEAPSPFTVYDKLSLDSMHPIFGQSVGGTPVALDLRRTAGLSMDDDDEAKLVCRFGTSPLGLEGGAIPAWANASWDSDGTGMLVCETPPYDEGIVLVEADDMGAPGASWTGRRYEFMGTPAVELVDPATAPASGGAEVTVWGFNFTNREGLSCAFGDVVVPATYYSEREIRCRAPRRVPGSVVLEVSMNGEDFTVSGHTFLFMADASVVGIEPDSGPIVGGTIVRVMGNFFVPGSGLVCRFGDVVVPVQQYISVNEVICISPPQRLHRSEAVFVEVSNNNGSFSNNLFSFTYHPTVMVLSINPTRAPAAQETQVYVRGFNFQDKKTLSCVVDDVVVPATYLGPDELFCLLPPHSPGDFAVEVSVNGQDFSVSDVTFTFNPPVTVSSLWPVMGSAAIAGTVVSVQGSGFIQGTDLVCRFGVIVVPATYVSNTTLLCASPPALPGLVYLEVSNNRMDFSSSGQQFLYIPDASIYAISPRRGPATGQNPVFVLGQNLVNTTALRCRFDSTVVRATFISPRLVVCMTPERFAGPSQYSKTVVVEVTNNGLDYTDSRIVFEFYDRCQPGYYCPGLAPLPCPNGTLCAGSNNFNFTLCSPGTFQPRTRQVECLLCPVGFYCPDFGLFKPVVCPAGYVCDTLGLRTPVTPCPPGHFCLPGALLDPIAGEG